MESVTQARRRLIASGIDFQSDGGGGFELYRDTRRVGRVFSEAGLIAWREESAAVVGVVMMDRDEARETIEQIKTHLDGMRKLLLDLEEREGWRALGYSSWRECAAAEFGQSTAHVYRLLTAAKIEQAIDSPIGEMPESHLRPLTVLDTPDQQKAALTRADQLAGDTPRTARHVQQAVQEIKPKPATCTRCGAERSEQRALTSYAADLVPEYPGRAVVLCSRCVPELLAARRGVDLPSTDQQTTDPRPVTPGDPSVAAEIDQLRTAFRAALPAPADDTPASDRAAYLIMEQEDRKWLGDAEMAIASAAYAYAGQLLDRVQVLTFARDQVRAQIPLTFKRPRRPQSADSSAVLAYLDQIETYATALEDYIKHIEQMQAA